MPKQDEVNQRLVEKVRAEDIQSVLNLLKSDSGLQPDEQGLLKAVTCLLQYDEGNESSLLKEPSATDFELLSLLLDRFGSRFNIGLFYRYLAKSKDIKPNYIRLIAIKAAMFEELEPNIEDVHKVFYEQLSINWVVAKAWFKAFGEKLKRNIIVDSSHSGVEGSLIHAAMKGPKDTAKQLNIFRFICTELPASLTPRQVIFDNALAWLITENKLPAFEAILKQSSEEDWPIKISQPVIDRILMQALTNEFYECYFDSECQRLSFIKVLFKHSSVTPSVLGILGAFKQLAGIKKRQRIDQSLVGDEPVDYPPSESEKAILAFLISELEKLPNGINEFYQKLSQKLNNHTANATFLKCVFEFHKPRKEQLIMLLHEELMAPTIYNFFRKRHFSKETAEAKRLPNVRDKKLLSLLFNGLAQYDDGIEQAYEQFISCLGLRCSRPAYVGFIFSLKMPSQLFLNELFSEAALKDLDLARYLIHTLNITPDVISKDDGEQSYYKAVKPSVERAIINNGEIRSLETFRFLCNELPEPFRARDVVFDLAMERALFSTSVGLVKGLEILKAAMEEGWRLKLTKEGFSRILKRAISSSPDGYYELIKRLLRYATQIGLNPKAQAEAAFAYLLTYKWQGDAASQRFFHYDKWSQVKRLLDLGTKIPLGKDCLNTALDIAYSEGQDKIAQTIKERIECLGHVLISFHG